MANELSVLNMDISKLSNDELNKLQSVILLEKIKRLESIGNENNKQIKRLADENKKHDTKIAMLEQKVEETAGLLENKSRVLQPKYGFVNQRDFGQFFSPSIGSKTVGKLLKVVGLAIKSTGRTIPYREYIPAYADTYTTESYTTIVWNYEKCVEKINEWLKEHSYYEKFYSIADTKEMEKFISDLYQKYC